MLKKERLDLRRLGIAVVPILPRHGLFLTLYPHMVSELTAAHEMGRDPAGRTSKPGRDSPRLSATPGSRIPLTARRAILRYWRLIPRAAKVEMFSFRTALGA